MRPDGPPATLQGVGWRRLPFGRWPWLCAGYLLTTIAVGVVAAAALAIPAIPWFILAGGGYPVGTLLLLLLLGAALLMVAGPLLALPPAALARRRLQPGAADGAPAALRQPGQGMAAWLRRRYQAPATWRELGYVCLLATIVVALSLTALATLPLALLFIAGPLLVLAQGPHGSQVALGFGNVGSVGQAIPYLVAGLAILPAVPYLVTLVAAADAAVARALLTDGPDERLRAELVEVSQSRARLADAFETERRRIERDLHDGAQQRLVSLTLQLGLARMDLPAGSPAAAPVAVAHEQAKQLMAELRELIHGIRPRLLADRGLPAALGELADQSPVPVSVDAAIGRLPDLTEATAYFVVAEALTNVARHSGATKASVAARLRSGVLTIEITDDGHGGADQRRGTGLTGLADRLAVGGGRMFLSSPAGGPTILRVELPCSLTQPRSG